MKGSVNEVELYSRLFTLGTFPTFAVICGAGNNLPDVPRTDLADGRHGRAIHQPGRNESQVDR